MSAPLRGARGCLSEAGLALLKQSPPGQAPAELAQHVASCGRCQDRLLAVDLGPEAGRARRRPPPLWRVFVLFAVGFGLALVAFWWIRRVLAGEV